MAENHVEVVGGVDTHKDTHVTAAVDTTGRLLGTASFAANAAGYRNLLAWLRSHGRVGCVGVEGHRLLRRRPGPLPHQDGCRSDRSEPSQPPVAPPVGQNRCHRRPGRSAGLPSTEKLPPNPKRRMGRSKGYECYEWPAGPR